MNQQQLPAPSNRPCDYIQIATSRSSQVSTAFEEIKAGLDGVDLCFVLLFFPIDFNPDEAATAIETYLGDHVVFGASSAGQITPEGYERDAYLAIGFTRQHFRLSSLLIDTLNPFSLDEVVERANKQFNGFAHTADWNRLGILIPDGLSLQEDVLVASLSAALSDTPIFGGSAAQNSCTGKTLIYAEKSFHDNAALLLLLETDLDYKMVQFDHFEPTDCKMVVTEVLADQRIILELNGAPAAKEYARVIGVKPSELSPELFAQHPLLIKTNDQYHVRSINRCEDNGGLSLLGAIDVGVILTLGEAGEIVRRLESELANAKLDDKAAEFILAFDCFLRRLEIEQTNRVERVANVLQQYQVVGFNTFGEQHSGMHVNQTFVGIAFYKQNFASLI